MMVYRVQMHGHVMRQRATNNNRDEQNGNLQSRGRLCLPKVLLISYIFCSHGALGPVRTPIGGIEREGCVSYARAKAEGGRPLCVGASYRGNECLCFAILTRVI
jgi:hypothetical protein